MCSDLRHRGAGAAEIHDLAAHIRETQPVEAGVLDMNRYQNL